MPGIQLRQERNIYSVVVQLRAKLRSSGMFKVPDSFYRLENITLIVWNTMAPQKFNILLLERLFGDDASLDCECSWPHDPDVNGRRKTRRNLPAMKTYSRSISAR